MLKKLFVLIALSVLLCGNVLADETLHLSWTHSVDVGLFGGTIGYELGHGVGSPTTIKDVGLVNSDNLDILTGEDTVAARSYDAAGHRSVWLPLIDNTNPFPPTLLQQN